MRYVSGLLRSDEALLLDGPYNFHLQWFAAEDEGRTEDPTEYKLRKAREEGKVAKSADLTSALVLLITIMMIAITGRYFLDTVKDMLTFFLTQSGSLDVTETKQLASAFFSYFMRLTIPAAATAFVAAFAGNVLQTGFLFSLKPITPDPKKVMPKVGQWAKRAFLSGEAAFNLLKAIVKVAIIGLISFLNIRFNVDRLVRLVDAPFLDGFTLIATLAFRITLEAALAMLLFALPDYIFQRRKHIDSLKMTKQEVKEERKTHEGDPMVKARLKQRMQELLTQNMVQQVPEADVVITNPTHFAVALQYKQGSQEAPQVVAKGQDEVAFRIRDLARQNDVPVVENKPLARGLYAAVEVGDQIPEEYYEVVAIILAQVYSMKGGGQYAV